MRKTLLSLLSTALMTSTMLSANVAAEPRLFGKQHPFATNDLPPGLLKDHLAKLPPQARQRALTWLHGIDFPAADAMKSLRVDAGGGVLYVDEAPVLPAGTDPIPTSTGATAVAVTTADAFRLHSKPGASRVLYLDFNGHTITGTAWNASSGVTRYDAVPYSVDTVIDTNFSATELQNIIGVWRRVAEDFAPFDVDVTTELPAAFGANVGHAVITRDSDANGVAMPYQGAGGVAYINVFGATNYGYYSPALVYANRLGGGREDYVAEATSHELGHNLGLSHDGTSTATYYGGHGAGANSWGPIMGTGYGRSVSQWSSGEYVGANNPQDDVAVVTGKLALRSDDHGNTNAAASLLLAGSDGTVTSTRLDQDLGNARPENKGLLSTRADIDVFSFYAAAGNVNLTITPHRMATNTLGGNLDVEAALYTEGGALVQRAGPDGDSRASIMTAVNAGRYFLHVAGVGDALSPYSDYGSVGLYYIDGSIPVGAVNTVPPSPNPMSFEVAPAATSANTIAMRAITALDDAGTAVQYRVDCISGGVGCVATGSWQSGRDFAVSGLAGGSTYAYRVLARDGFGNETAPSATLSATTPVVNQPPVAVSDKGAARKLSSVTLAVLANDRDPDGDQMQISAVSKPAKGSVIFTATSVTYRSANRNGNDTFTYTVVDGRGGSATATVTVSVK